MDHLRGEAYTDPGMQEAPSRVTVLVWRAPEEEPETRT